VGVHFVKLGQVTRTASELLFVKLHHLFDQTFNRNSCFPTQVFLDFTGVTNVDGTFNSAIEFRVDGNTNYAILIFGNFVDTLASPCKCFADLGKCDINEILDSGSDAGRNDLHEAEKRLNRSQLLGGENGLIHSLRAIQMTRREMQGS